jgi:tRNA threonylcarbamoyladenosine biosynthesis protein TsaE
MNQTPESQPPARIVESGAPEETEALGRRFGETAPAGGVLALTGELGAGKTCFVRGLAAGLGADADEVHSPSFIMMTEYRGGRLPLHHVDLYRLEQSRIDEIWLRDALYGNGVAAVEWFDRLGSASPADFLAVEFRYRSQDGRTIRVTARGARHARWLAAALGD